MNHETITQFFLDKVLLGDMVWCLLRYYCGVSQFMLHIFTTL